MGEEEKGELSISTASMNLFLDLVLICGCYLTQRAFLMLGL